MMTPEELQDARELWNIPGTLGWKAINHIDEQEKEIVALKQEVKSLEKGIESCDNTAWEKSE